MNRDLPMLGIGMVVGGGLAALAMTLAPAEPTAPAERDGPAAQHVCWEDEIQWVTPDGIMCHPADALPPGAMPDDGRPADYHHEMEG